MYVYGNLNKMQITRNVFTISDLTNWYEDKTLIVNKDYQREGGIWVTNARTYFIDTILNGFPFPKITIRQIIDLKSRKTIREIIDGQQRMMTISSFINSEYALSSVSENYGGKKFSDLDPEVQEAVLRYEVSVDMVISATEEEVLEIFRRMNSYTLALNPPEQRHASYQGEFKWFIKDLIKTYDLMLLNFKTLTKKQISRMGDADLLTELVQILLTGVVSRSKSSLDKLYYNYDQSFPNKNSIDAKTKAILNFIKDDLVQVGNSGYLSGYMLYSLFAALAINKYGDIKTADQYFDDLVPIDNFSNNPELASQTILEMFSAIDRKEIDGKYGEFVKASLATTHSVKNRQVRSKWLALALRNEL